MLYKIIGIFIVLIASLFFIQQINAFLPELKELFTDYQFKPKIILTVNLYLILVINGGLIWHTLMKGFGNFKQPFIKSLHIFLVSQLAKYIPGNVGHHVGRLYLAKKYNYNSMQVVASILIETLLPIIASAIFSLYLIYQYQLKITDYIKTNLSNEWGQFIIVLIVLLFITLLIFKKRISKLISQKFNSKLHFRNVIFSFFLTLINFIILGCILFILIKNYSTGLSADFFLITSIFAISWLLGFITPGSPGGIGVREALLVTFLSPIYGHALAVWFSIVLRIITTLGDGLAFILGLILSRYSQSSNTS